jgi:hypothetical protein
VVWETWKLEAGSVFVASSLMLVIPQTSRGVYGKSADTDLMFAMCVTRRCLRSMRRKIKVWRWIDSTLLTTCLYGSNFTSTLILVELSSEAQCWVISDAGSYE